MPSVRCSEALLLGDRASRDSSSCTQPQIPWKASIQRRDDDRGAVGGSGRDTTLMAGPVSRFIRVRDQF